MPNYRRNRVMGGTYFFTANLLDRQSDLLVRYIDSLREAVRNVREKHPFYIDAWVVLPEHTHCVWTLPPDDSDFPTRWMEIKMLFSAQIPKETASHSDRQRKRERNIWQQRYWEHTIRDDRDYAAHVNYCYVNPLKHGLVRHVRDWPHSSFHRDARSGLYSEDWCGNILDMEAGED